MINWKDFVPWWYSVKKKKSKIKKWILIILLILALIFVAFIMFGSPIITWLQYR